MYQKNLANVASEMERSGGISGFPCHELRRVVDEVLSLLARLPSEILLGEMLCRCCTGMRTPR